MAMPKEMRQLLSRPEAREMTDIISSKFDLLEKSFAQKLEQTLFGESYPMDWHRPYNEDAYYHIALGIRVSGADIVHSGLSVKDFLDQAEDRFYWESVEQ